MIETTGRMLLLSICISAESPVKGIAIGAAYVLVAMDSERMARQSPLSILIMVFLFALESGEWLLRSDEVSVVMIQSGNRKKKSDQLKKSLEYLDREVKDSIWIGMMYSNDD